jgi:predicted ATPase
VKRAIIFTLAILTIIIFAGCSDPAKETMRIEEGKYSGAKFEYQMETKIVHKVIYRAEDVSNLISNFNSLAMEKRMTRLKNGFIE